MAHAAIVIMALALSGCGAFAFDNYNRRSSTVAVVSDDCSVEVHRGEVTGGPAIGHTKNPDSVDIRPDIDHEN